MFNFNFDFDKNFCEKFYSRFLKINFCYPLSIKCHSTINLTPLSNVSVRLIMIIIFFSSPTVPTETFQTQHDHKISKLISAPSFSSENKTF